MRICFVIGAFGVRVTARVTTGEFTITSSIHDSDPMVGTTVGLKPHITGESGKTDNEGYEDDFEPLTGHEDDKNQSVKDTALLESEGDAYTNAGSADDYEDDFEPETAQEAEPLPSQKVIDDEPSSHWKQYDDMKDEASDEYGDDFDTETDNSREALDWDGVAVLLEDDDSDVGLDNFDFHAIRGEEKKGKESGTKVIDAPSGLGWDHIASLLESRTHDETLERDVNRNEGEQEIHNTEFNDDTLTKTKGSLGIGWDEIGALLKTDSEKTIDRSTDHAGFMNSLFASFDKNSLHFEQILEKRMNAVCPVIEVSFTTASGFSSTCLEGLVVLHNEFLGNRGLSAEAETAVLSAIDFKLVLLVNAIQSDSLFVGVLEKLFGGREFRRTDQKSIHDLLTNLEVEKTRLLSFIDSDDLVWHSDLMTSVSGLGSDFLNLYGEGFVEAMNELILNIASSNDLTDRLLKNGEIVEIGSDLIATVLANKVEAFSETVATQMVQEGLQWLVPAREDGVPVIRVVPPKTDENPSSIAEKFVSKFHLFLTKNLDVLGEGIMERCPGLSSLTVLRSLLAGTDRFANDLAIQTQKRIAHQLIRAIIKKFKTAVKDKCGTRMYCATRSVIISDLTAGTVQRLLPLPSTDPEIEKLWCSGMDDLLRSQLEYEDLMSRPEALVGLAGEDFMKRIARFIDELVSALNGKKVEIVSKQLLQIKTRFVNKIKSIWLEHLALGKQVSHPVVSGKQLVEDLRSRTSIVAEYAFGLLLDLAEEELLNWLGAKCGECVQEMLRELRK